MTKLGVDVLDAVAIHDGRTLLGYVHKHGSEWLALGHTEQRIGSFANRTLATRAVMDAYTLATGRAGQ